MEQTDLFSNGLPVLPYNGSSGHSGTETSRARATHADSSGLTAEVQKSVVRVLRDSGWRGKTWRELGIDLNLHHGTVSGALSVLHKQGLISRLKETRQRCKVYVLNQYVNGRVTENQGRKKACPHCGGEL